jgi:hypothetical protein
MGSTDVLLRLKLTFICEDDNKENTNSLGVVTTRNNFKDSNKNSCQHPQRF